MSCSFFKSSVGKKYVMGITGLVWAGFVFAHMAGNFLLFLGADAYNSYSHALTSGKFIYVAEAVLILSLIVHVACAISLTRENRKARGTVRYAKEPNGLKGASLASRTMAIQGSLILFFIISHLRGFKFGTYYETMVEGEVMRDIHRVVVETFSQPGFLVWYLICMVLLGFHLSHGVGSIFQSLGLKTDHYAPMIKKISIFYALVVAGGFLIQPIYVFLTSGQG